jgi:hypothetical protein
VIGWYIAHLVHFFCISILLGGNGEWTYDDTTLTFVLPVFNNQGLNLCRSNSNYSSNDSATENLYCGIIKKPGTLA